MGGVAAVLSLLAPLAFAGVFLRRAMWKQGRKVVRSGAVLVRSERDRWSYDYSFSEFWSGEVRKHRQH